MKNINFDKSIFRTRAKHFLPGLLVLLASFPAWADSKEIVIADFEGSDYGAWRVTGEAFGTAPAHGSLPGQMAVEGFKGHGLANSFNHGDDATGTLTSPDFKIERSYIQFLIGGGKFPGRTCMNLLCDGKVVRTATGPNDRPGGSERLEGQSWDVRDLSGKTAHLEIIDEATGGWGHINIDQIVQTDQKLPELRLNVRQDFQITSRYLSIPIKNGAQKRQVSVSVDGQTQVRNEIELADGDADWWACMEVSQWHGRQVSVEVDRLMEDSQALQSIRQADDFTDAEAPYRENLRPQLHFSSRRGWNNDPNGLCYFGGEYHLFYQHNPYGWDWGNMHWGHSVSSDLVHWRELGDVLTPDSLGAMFSGSAVLDAQNTSGFGAAGRPPLVLIYTAAGDSSVQCLASSLDGRTFTKFSGNPVLKQITPGNRDPKVFWHAPSKKWVMCLYVETNQVHTIHLLSSTDLKDWTVMSHTDGLFECPDMFELPVAGGNPKWVLTGASSEYFVGSFDGTTFTPETPKLPGNRGQGFYAAQTFSDIPSGDGRRIQIGWLRAPSPGMSFNQAMSIPQELKLTGTPEGPRLTRTPVKELNSLRAQAHEFKPQTLAANAANPLAGMNAELVELRAEFEPGDAQTTFNIRGATIVYDGQKQEIVVNGHAAPAPKVGERQNLTIYCDRTTLEVFTSDGLTYVPMPFIPKANNRQLTVEVSGASVKFTALNVYELKSIWEPVKLSESK